MTLLSATPMREEEKYCANKLREYLVSQGYNAVFKDGSDPPDIEFTVDGHRWAVEHTQLFQYVESGKELSRNYIDATNLAVEPRLLEKTNGKRKSGWRLALYGHIEPKKFKLIERTAIKSIIADSIDPFSIISSQLAELIKVEDSNCQIIVYSMLPPSSKVPKSKSLSADIQATIDYAFQRILTSKAPTLGQLKEYDKRVLLIQSQYMFVNNSNLTKSVSTHIALKNGIDKIFLITSEEVSEIG